MLEAVTDKQSNFAAAMPYTVYGNGSQAYNTIQTQNATDPQAQQPGGQLPVQVVTYSWPDMKPERMIHYSQRLLQMPIRHDILHRAVVYEGDATRQGTASTKWRDEVHGSHRKLYARRAPVVPVQVTSNRQFAAVVVWPTDPILAISRPISHERFMPKPGASPSATGTHAEN